MHILLMQERKTYTCRTGLLKASLMKDVYKVLLILKLAYQTKIAVITQATSSFLGWLSDTF